MTDDVKETDEFGEKVNAAMDWFIKGGMFAFAIRFAMHDDIKKYMEILKKAKEKKEVIK